MVYVLNRDGNALMPTERYGKVRRLLRDGLAVTVRRTPFTVTDDFFHADEMGDIIFLSKNIK